LAASSAAKPADEAQRINCATPARRREVLNHVFFRLPEPRFFRGLFVLNLAIFGPPRGAFDMSKHTKSQNNLIDIQ